MAIIKVDMHQINCKCSLSSYSEIVYENITWALALAAPTNSIESPLLASLCQWLGNVS